MDEDRARYVPYYPQSTKDPAFPDGYRRYVLDTEKDFLDVLRMYSQKKVFSLDTETTSLSSIEGEIVGYSFAAELDKGFYIPMRHKVGDNMPLEVARKGLQEICKRKLLFYNAKFDMRFIRKEGVPDDMDFLDIMGMVWNMDTNVRMPKLKIQGMRILLGWLEVKEYEEVLGDKKDLSELDPYECVDYVCWDVLSLMHLISRYSNFYRDNKFILDLDSILVKEVMWLEDIPHRIDRDLISKYDQWLQLEIEKLKTGIAKHIQVEKLTSRQQVGKALQAIGVDTGMYTPKTKVMQITEEALVAIKESHPVIPLLLKFYEFSNLYSNYTDKLLANIRDGGCRFNYFTFLAITGRLASGEEKEGRNSFYASYNLQSTVKSGSQMYRAEECEYSQPGGILGYMFIPDDKGEFEGENQELNIRSAFIPDEDCYFVHIDFKSEELRVAANMSGDPVMRKNFLSGEDYHKMTAIALLDGDVTKYNKEIRKVAKINNFRNLYGGYPNKNDKKDKVLFDKWWKTHIHLKKWCERIQAEAQNRGWVKTYFGRIRRLKSYYDNPSQVGYADRSAVNTVIQGSCGDIMRICLVRLGELTRTMKIKGFRVLSDVHDEINLSIPKKEIGHLLPIVLKSMEIQIPEWPIPLTVDYSIGTSWGNTFPFSWDETKSMFVPMKD